MLKTLKLLNRYRWLAQRLYCPPELEATLGALDGDQLKRTARQFNLVGIIELGAAIFGLAILGVGVWALGGIAGMSSLYFYRGPDGLMVDRGALLAFVIMFVIAWGYISAGIWGTLSGLHRVNRRVRSLGDAPSC